LRELDAPQKGGGLNSRANFCTIAEKKHRYLFFSDIEIRDFEVHKTNQQNIHILIFASDYGTLGYSGKQAKISQRNGRK
jgi:hypothetical protein